MGQLDINRGTGRTTRMLARVRREVAAGKFVIVLATDPVWKMVCRDLNLGEDDEVAEPMGDGSFQMRNGARVKRGISCPDPGTGRHPSGAGVVIADHYWLEEIYGWVLNEWFRDQP